MGNLKHIKIHVALISILLLVGQFGALSHSVEHPFHGQDQSCEIYLQCEKSANGLIYHHLQLAIPASETIPTSQTVIAWLSLPQTSYFARAPPFLS